MIYFNFDNSKPKLISKEEERIIIHQIPFKNFDFQDGFMIKNVRLSKILDQDYTKVGFERIEDCGTFFRFWLPYVYFKSENTWCRIHSGGGNINGVMGAKIICEMLDMEYKLVDSEWTTEGFYPKEAVKVMPMMYFSGYQTTERQALHNYKPKGESYNDMKFFEAINIYNSFK